MRSSVVGAERAIELHKQCQVKLDAAEYAFERMLEELSAAMTVPRSGIARPSAPVVMPEVELVPALAA